MSYEGLFELHSCDHEDLHLRKSFVLALRQSYHITEKKQQQMKRCNMKLTANFSSVSFFSVRSDLDGTSACSLTAFIAEGWQEMRWLISCALFAW